MPSIYDKPKPNQSETFFQLTYDRKTEDEMQDVLLALAKADDGRDMIEVIFKKCKHHEVRMRAGKILYYNGF